MIPLFRPYVAPREALLPALEHTLYSGYLAEGERVKEFEGAFAQFIGAQHCAALGSCTAALHVALLVAGATAGTEVISTPMTAEPTNLAIYHTGAHIVWADVLRNGNIDPTSAAERVTPATRAIMVVHYGGVPAPMGRIMQVAAAHSLYVIEDCAHALGARYTGYHVGTLGDFGAFSFQAIKHLTTGDGGMLAIDDDRKLPDIRVLRWFGIDREQSRTETNVEMAGYKYNMNDITATMGLVQLEHIRSVIDLHVYNGHWFERELADIPDLEIAPVEGEPSYWFFTVLTPRRDELMAKLIEADIACGLVHRRNDMHSVFERSNHVRLPHLDEFWRTALHIPCGWWLTEGERDHIAQTIREALA